MSQARRSFAAPDTHYHLLRYSTTWPGTDVVNGRPSGHIVCLACGESSLNVDEINHPVTCPQHDVHSRWYWETHADE